MNPVAKTKLSRNSPHRRSTTVSFSNLPLTPSTAKHYSLDSEDDFRVSHQCNNSPFQSSTPTRPITLYELLLNYVTFHPKYLWFSFKRTNTMSAPSHSTGCEARDQTVSESMWPGQFGSWTRDTQRKRSPSSSWKARDVVCPQGLAERVSPNSSPIWIIVPPL